MLLSIIIPSYNEEKTIKEVIKKVNSVSLPKTWRKEIIVVDDDSKDKTKEILKELKGIKVIFKEKNEGKGSALKEGFKIANGDYLLIQDADLEYDPNDYPRLLEPLIENKTKIVFGSRLLKKDNIPYSKIFFYGGISLTKVFNFLFKANLTDIFTCYKIFPREFIPKLMELPSNDFVFDAVELTYTLHRKNKILEIPITYKSRSKEEGKKIKWTDGFKCFLAMINIAIYNLIRK